MQACRSCSRPTVPASFLQDSHAFCRDSGRQPRTTIMGGATERLHFMTDGDDAAGERVCELRSASCEPLMQACHSCSRPTHLAGSDELSTDQPLAEGVTAGCGSTSAAADGDDACLPVGGTPVLLSELFQHAGEWRHGRQLRTPLRLGRAAGAVLLLRDPDAPCRWTWRRAHLAHTGDRGRPGISLATRAARLGAHSLLSVCGREGCHALVDYVCARRQANAAGRGRYMPGDGCASRLCSAAHKPGKHARRQRAAATALRMAMKVLIELPGSIDAVSVALPPRSAVLAAASEAEAALLSAAHPLPLRRLSRARRAVPGANALPITDPLVTPPSVTLLPLTIRAAVATIPVYALVPPPHPSSPPRLHQFVPVATTVRASLPPTGPVPRPCDGSAGAPHPPSRSPSPSPPCPSPPPPLAPSPPPPAPSPPPRFRELRRRSTYR